MNMSKEFDKIKEKLSEILNHLKPRVILFKDKLKKDERLQKLIRHKYFKAGAAAAGAIVILCSFLYSGSSFRINGLMEKADKYYYNTKYDQAISCYKKILTAKKDPLAAAKIADIYAIKGDKDNSRSFIDKAKAMGNLSSEAMNYIVFDELITGDYAAAAADGETALSKYPGDKQLIKTMYAAYMAKGDTSKAAKIIGTYDKDLKTAYDNAEYARMLMISGQMDKGLSVLRHAYDLDMDEYKIYDVLSQTSVYNKDDLLEAIAKLSKDHSNDPAYKVWMAKIYSLDPSTATDAKKILDTLDVSKLGSLEIKLIQAVVYQNTGEGTKADGIINKIIQENSSDYRVLHTAGWFYLNKKDYTKAQEYCSRSIEANKDYTDNYSFLMPEILKGEGKESLSEPYFRTALQREPYNYNIMLNTGNYYLDSGNKDKALEYFKLAGVVKPLDSEIKYNTAVIYLTMKKDVEGIALLKECIKLDDSNPKYHRTLGTVYYLQGNKKDALVEIRYAYNADENDILTLNNAGCYYVAENYDVERGLYNLTKAVQGIDKNTDAYTKETINANYKKVKQLSDDLKKSKINDKLKVPELVLFY